MIALLRRLWLRTMGDAHDSAWKATGVRYTHTGHDYQKAQAGYRRSRRQSETGRPLPVPKKPKAAPVVSLDARRKAGQR